MLPGKDWLLSNFRQKQQHRMKDDCLINWGKGQNKVTNLWLSGEPKAVKCHHNEEELDALLSDHLLKFVACTMVALQLWMLGFHHTNDISQLWQQISRHISSTKKSAGMISHNPNIHSHFPSSTNTKLQISADNSESGSNKQVCVTFQSLDWPLNQLPALLSCIPSTHQRRTDCVGVFAKQYILPADVPRGNWHTALGQTLLTVRGREKREGDI